jgi:regulator of replication initiation timing
MTITQISDREIALQAQLAAMTASRDEYQQAADKMAMEHKVERDKLRQHIKHIGNDALRSENHELRQQLADATALIEASRKQEPVAWFELNESLDAWFLAYGFNPKGKTRPLYVNPVVADDVLKDAERLDWLDKNIFNRENVDWVTNKVSKTENMWVMFAPVGVHGSARAIIDAAMKGTAC